MSNIGLNPAARKQRRFMQAFSLMKNIAPECTDGQNGNCQSCCKRYF